MKTLLERWLCKVQVAPGDGCWLWMGSLDPAGYGRVLHNGKAPITASRAAWILAHGPIPDGMHVCHHCDNPRCARPSHLFLGTPADNSQDAINKGRIPRGERAKNAKLTEEDVRTIRRLVAGGAAQKMMAERFGVSHANISLIVSRKNWSHVA